MLRDELRKIEVIKAIKFNEKRKPKWKHKYRSLEQRSQIVTIML
jgi:hypothetical protein